MQVVTIASHEPKEDYYSYQEFLASLKRFDIEPIILKDGYGGLGTKPVMLRKAILDGLIDGITSDHQIVFCDAFDVIFQRDPRDAEAFGTSHLFFGAEKNLFPPNAELEKAFPLGPFRFLNSGCSVGSTNNYVNAINGMPKESLQPDKQKDDGSWWTPNDQELWQHQYALGGMTPNIRLDNEAQFVLNLHEVSMDDVEVSNGLIRYKPTGSVPIALHMNGAKQPWKTFLKESLKL